jgi:hypothetical protein
MLLKKLRLLSAKGILNMTEVCEVCGKESTKYPKKLTQDHCNRGWSDDGNSICYEIGYELQKKRAELAEAAEQYGRDAVRAYAESENAAVARAEVAEANYRFMVEQAADQHLDGYRELASRLENAESRATRLEAALLKYGSHKVGCELYYEAGGRCNCGFDTALRGEPAIGTPVEDVIAAIDQMEPCDGDHGTWRCTCMDEYPEPDSNGEPYCSFCEHMHSPAHWGGER